MIELHHFLCQTTREAALHLCEMVAKCVDWFCEGKFWTDGLLFRTDGELSLADQDLGPTWTITPFWWQARCGGFQSSRVVCCCGLPSSRVLLDWPWELPFRSLLMSHPTSSVILGETMGTTFVSTQLKNHSGDATLKWSELNELNDSFYLFS